MSACTVSSLVRAKVRQSSVLFLSGRKSHQLSSLLSEWKLDWARRITHSNVRRSVLVVSPWNHSTCFSLNPWQLGTIHATHQVVVISFVEELSILRSLVFFRKHDWCREPCITHPWPFQILYVCDIPHDHAYPSISLYDSGFPRLYKLYGRFLITIYIHVWTNQVLKSWWQ